MEETENIQEPSPPRGPVFAGDRALWVIIAILCTLSLLVVYSATNSKAYADAGGDTTHYMLNQLKFIALGVGIMYFVHRIDYQVYSRFALLAFGFAILLQLLTFVIGVDLNGAKRALQVPLTGFTFQPSDFLKVTLVLVLARQLAQRQAIINKIKLLPQLITVRNRRGKRSVEFNSERSKNMGILTGTTIPLLLPVAITCILVMPSNLSTAVIIFISCWIMLYIGRAKLSELVRLMTIVFVTGLTAILLMGALNIWRGPTWVARLKEFTGITAVTATTPGAAQQIDADTEQADNAKIAIASGGVIGKGPGRSTQRARLSHSYSDFAYAFIAEEYGLLGAMGVLILYLWLFFRTIAIFQRCGTAFPSLLVLGLGLMIFLQAAINMLVSVGLFPVTGQNLPLISMGGSSVFFISLALGMILGVSRQMQEQTLDKPKGESLLEK